MKKFPFYIDNLIKNARIVIYVFAATDFHSIDDITNHVTHTRKIWERTLEKKYKKLIEFVFITKTDLTLGNISQSVSEQELNECVQQLGIHALRQMSVPFNDNKEEEKFTKEIIEE